MCGLRVLRATVCQYESKSVTQREAERRLEPQPLGSGEGLRDLSRRLVAQGVHKLPDFVALAFRFLR